MPGKKKENYYHASRMHCGKQRLLGSAIMSIKYCTYNTGPNYSGMGRKKCRYSRLDRVYLENITVKKLTVITNRMP